MSPSALTTNSDNKTATTPTARFLTVAWGLVSQATRAENMKIPKFTAPWWMFPRVLFVIAMFGLVLVGTVVVAFCRYSTDSISTKIDFAAKAAFGSAALLSLTVGYQTLRLNIHQKQTEAAFEFLRRYDGESEKLARRRVEKFIENTGSLREYANDFVPLAREAGFVEAMKIQPDIEESMLTVLAYFEDLSLALRSGYASEAVVYRSIYPSAIRLVMALRPFINFLRKKDSEPSYFIDSLALVERWRKGLSVHAKDSDLRATG